MGDLVPERTSLVLNLGSVRCVSLLLGIGNLVVALLGIYQVILSVPSCYRRMRFSIAMVAVFAGLRILSLFRVGQAQMATAETIIGNNIDNSVIPDSVIRQERRMRYRRWLWWTRIGSAMTILQFVGALYLMIVMANGLSYYENTEDCFLGKTGKGGKHTLMVSYLILVWLVVIIQCFTGSDVLRWRSFYATHDTAWKAHYQEECFRRR